LNQPNFWGIIFFGGLINPRFIRNFVAKKLMIEAIEEIDTFASIVSKVSIATINIIITF